MHSSISSALEQASLNLAQHLAFPLAQSSLINTTIHSKRTENIPMKLYSFPTSPYVRKVMVMAIELGLEDKLQVETTPVRTRD